jgi:aminoglycoside phosphotransferase (APT) family kinase protein
VKICPRCKDIDHAEAVSDASSSGSSPQFAAFRASTGTGTNRSLFTRASPASKMSNRLGPVKTENLRHIRHSHESANKADDPRKIAARTPRNPRCHSSIKHQLAPLATNRWYRPIRHDAGMKMHEDELDVDVSMVRDMIADQFPQWSALPIVHVAPAGTVNAIFRVGDSLSARLPLHMGDPEEVRDWLTAEAVAASEFAVVSTVPSPVPIAFGEPGHGYPQSWAVQTWVPGRDAVAADPAASPTFALELATLLASLRKADTQGRRFSGEGRGGHLPDHDEWIGLCFAKSEGLVDVVRLKSLWGDLRVLPEVDQDVMCHGDLTPQNVLVEAAHLVGVLDTGGFGPADPALDLVSVWHLLDDQRRELVRQQLRCGDVQWRRGMAWALQQAMGLVWYYAETNPTMSQWGLRTLERLVEASAP